MKVHIQLVQGQPTESRVLVDDVDITRHVLIEGFAVQVEPGRPLVSLQLRPDVLEVDVDGPAGEVIQRIRAETNLTASTGDNA